MLASVTIDVELFVDLRVDLMARALGCSANEAIGSLVRLWAHAYAQGAAVLPRSAVELTLGERGARALVHCGLGVEVAQGIELKGVAKRLSAREALLSKVAKAGAARAKTAVRDARGRLVSRSGHQHVAGAVQHVAGGSPAYVQHHAGDLQHVAGGSPAWNQQHAGEPFNSERASTSNMLVVHQHGSSNMLESFSGQRERSPEEDQISLSDAQNLRDQNQLAQRSTQPLDQHLPSQPLRKKNKGGRPRSGRGPLPADWSPEVAPATPWEADQLARFRDHFAANGKVMADWGAAWRNWLRRAPEFAPGFAPARVSTPAPTRPTPQAERPVLSEQERFPLNPSLQAFIEKIHAERQAAAAAEQAGEASPAAQEAS